MEAYRDQYATLFHNGRKVTVIGISVDADTTQANWAHESDFPIVFASDSGSVVGKMYGAYDAQNKVDNRSLFVVGPDGRITYVVKPFKVLAPASYTDLAHAIDKTAPAATPSAAGK
jgi:thioredoxin-dependent peroxiredoxin